MSVTASAQDMNLYLSEHMLAGKKIIKVAHDFYDEYMWVLAQNNEIFRVNTKTGQIDDVSGFFSAYTNYRLFDIAGFRKNVVAVAGKDGTKSVAMVYHEGNIRFPMEEDLLHEKIEGTITSIGASSQATESTFLNLDPLMLLIATDRGIARFDLETGVNTLIGRDPSQIYAANYRNQLFTGPTNRGVYSPDLPFVFTTSSEYSVYFDYGNLRKGPAYGTEINTAYATVNGLRNSGFYTTPDLFWGSNDGMYQVKLRLNPEPLSTYKKYLEGVKVNKVIDIYGLKAFGSSAANEHLLIGTDNGFYYSNSFLLKSEDPNLNDITLYHYDKLGNTKINFVEVNPLYITDNMMPTYCEDGIWLATDDGLFLLRPDYTPYVDPAKQVQAVTFYQYEHDVTSQDICEGKSIKLTVDRDVTATHIQWFKDGVELLNETGREMEATATGDYYAVLYDPCGTLHLETNRLKVNVIASPVFTFDYPDKLQLCGKISATLAVTNSPAYSYRWYTDNYLNGNTTATYEVKESGVYWVELSACGGTWVSSKKVQVDLINLPLPTVTTPKTTYCEGETAQLTTNVALSSEYDIGWYKDGVMLPGTTNLSTINATTNGSYSVVLTSTLSDCTSPATPVQLSFMPAPVFSFNYADKLPYCEGATVKLEAGSPAGTYQYRWYKDGVLMGATTPGLNITQSGKYKVEASSCEGSWLPSKEVEVNFIALPVPVISATKASYCEGETARLTANVGVNGAYEINWYKDGVLMPGTSNLSTINTTANGSYSVMLTSTAANCTSPAAPLQVDFKPAPVFSFNYPDKLQYCQGATVQLEAGSPAGAYQYRWYKDGVLTSGTKPSLSITQSGKYKVEASSCESSWLPSKEVEVTIIALPVPVITANKPEYCEGDNAALSISTPVSAAYTLTWHNNGVPVAGSENKTNIIAGLPGEYTVRIISNTPNTDGSFCSQTSTARSILFNAPPTVSIEKVVKTTLCDGQEVELRANYSGGTLRWSTGETTPSILVRRAGDYSVTLSKGGCQVSASLQLQLLPLPTFAIKDTSVCTYKHQAITISAPEGFAAYAWNGVTGSLNYDVSQPQTLTLTVADANGCQATKEIHVTEQCPNVIVANTFTPNFDGINDTWEIGGLTGDATAVVKVFNRNGETVYESKSYSKSWDGSYHGSKLPAGTYYYIITAKKNTEKYSGWVAILY